MKIPTDGDSGFNQNTPKEALEEVVGRKKLKKAVKEGINAMPMSFPTIESSTGVISFEDVVAPVTSITDPVPETPKSTKIGILGSKPTEGEDADGILITPSIMAEGHPEWLFPTQQAYVGTDWVGSAYLWNTDATDERNEAVLQEAQAQVGTLIVLYPTYSDFPLDQTIFKGVVILQQTTATTTDELDDWVALQNHGAFVDTNSEAKALWVVSRYLENYADYPPLTTLRNDAFTGITDIGIAQTLDDAGYSYFFKSTNACWCRSFFIGRQQARVVYADSIIAAECQNAVADFVGQMYTQETLDQIKAQLNETMSILQFNELTNGTKSISVPQFNTILEENIRNGIVPNVVIQYYYGVEIRTINITIQGSYL